MTTDSTMPRRDEDSDNWGGARPGAGKPAKDPAVKVVTFGISVRGGIKARFDALPDEQKKAIRAQLAAELERLVTAQEG